jgi:hypothetical protein
MVSRRRFISGLGAAAVAARLAPLHGVSSPPLLRWRDGLPNPAIGWRGESAFSLGLRAGTIALDSPDVRPRRNPTPPVDWTATAATLRQRFRDLRRHFVFEYYPWYGTNPWRHWEQWDRHPPADIAATSVPVLGAYDSRDSRVIEQHARWIAETGAGAINISWWGRGSYEDRAVPLIMDVMRDHDIHVTFHLEPYADNRAFSYVDDVLYLLREYGEKRRWDCILLPEDASGRVGPVFKSFRTIVPQQGSDCHGNVFVFGDYVPDPTWRRQTDSVRTTLRSEFDRVTLLADVTDVGRMLAAGFDGMAIYDNFLLPSSWPALAEACSSRNLIFSFNVNPGFDGIAMRTVDPGSCYVPTPLQPSGAYDLSDAHDRERLAHETDARVAETFRSTIALQTDPALTNARRGFFLTYINSFNEWHEGHQFEPAKNAGDLTAAERAATTYHNPAIGDHRLRRLEALLDLVLTA